MDNHTGQGSLPTDYLARLARRDLSGCDLNGADLSDGQFEGVIFRNANLSNAKLNRSNCRRADFQGATLAGTDLLTADLREACLKQSQLSGASLRDADLQRADLAEVVGLLPEQLAGTNLAGAKLPGEIGAFTSLAVVKETSANAKALSISLFLACLYSWLTIGTTRDVQLLTDSASSPLPIIQTSVPIVGFYVLAPLLLIGAYLYFHFYLQNLWEELSILPAVFPDGRPLFAKSDPWLLNDMVRAYLSRLKRNRPFMSYLEESVSVLLAWWFVPFTLLLFWFRYLTRQDWRGTTLHIVLTTFSVMAATSLRALARRTLQGSYRPPFDFRNIKRLWSPVTLIVGVTTALILSVISFGIIDGNRASMIARNPRTWTPGMLAWLGYNAFADFSEKDVSTKPVNWTGKDPSQVDLVKGATLRARNLRYLDARRSFLVNADLANANLRNADLGGTNLEHADLHGADLRGAEIGIGAPWEEFLIGAGSSMPGNVANLKRTNLNEADLRNAHLLAVQLQEANLTFSKMQGTVLSGVNMSGADLRDAELDGLTDIRGEPLDMERITAHVELAQQQLDKACGDDTTKLPPTPFVSLSIPLCPEEVPAMLAQHKLWYDSKGREGKQSRSRNLSDLKLDYAFLPGSSLGKARLIHTMLSFANLTQANLQGARLNTSVLASANLAHANLRGADLRRAFLDHADLTSADLSGANLENAILIGADLSKADLRNTKGMTAQQIRQAQNWETALYSPDFRKSLAP